MVDCSDLQLMRRIRNSLCDGLASGPVAHRTPGLARELGLTGITVTPATIVLRELEAAELVLGLAHAARAACDNGSITDDDRTSWTDDLRQREADNRFLAAVTGFITSAVKTATR